MDTQLKKGILTICILSLLADGDKYGYDIVKKMQTLFYGTEESTLYAILRRLHNDGYTTMYYSESASLGPRRKYYKINKKGTDYLKESISDLYEIQNIFSELGIINKYSGKCDIPRFR